MIMSMMPINLEAMRNMVKMTHNSGPSKRIKRNDIHYFSHMGKGLSWSYLRGMNLLTLSRVLRQCSCVFFESKNNNVQSKYKVIWSKLGLLWCIWGWSNGKHYVQDIASKMTIFTSITEISDQSWFHRSSLMCIRCQ